MWRPFTLRVPARCSTNYGSVFWAEQKTLNPRNVMRVSGCHHQGVYKSGFGVHSRCVPSFQGGTEFPSSLGRSTWVFSWVRTRSRDPQRKFDSRGNFITVRSGRAGVSKLLLRNYCLCQLVTLRALKRHEQLAY